MRDKQNLKMWRNKNHEKIRLAKGRWRIKKNSLKEKCFCGKDRSSLSVYCNYHAIQNIPGIDRNNYNALNYDVKKDLQISLGFMGREEIVLYALWMNSRRVIRKKEIIMDIKKITSEINSPSMQALAEAILETVSAVQSGKKNYNQGLVELQGYKQVLQIQALEVMRRRLPLSAPDYK